MARTTRREDLVQVQDINQFVYCPRRYYYQKFFDTVGNNYELTDGRSSHKRSSTRGGWTKEIYLRSEKYQLHGKIDILEENDSPTPIERKRSESGAYYESDELQLAAYSLLLEDNISGSVNVGYIYTGSNDRRHAIRISDWHREQVSEIVSTIQNMTVDDVPPLVENPNKCEKCSTREYCLPRETAMLEPHHAEGTGWEERV